jgi:ectoine hydroxylase-related dioxygenase (phytanoyl-CoA dioxygenase family)
MPTADTHTADDTHTTELSALPLRIEELKHRGFSVLTGAVAPPVLAEARERLGAVYEQQVRETGASLLAQINEQDLARCPLAYDPFFLRFANHSEVTRVAHTLIGGQYVLLHLQNGIINRPAQKHHQTHWHRDLPYQEFVSSRPLAISALFCIDDFTVETGCTYVLPASHRAETFPSAAYVDAHEYPVEAPAGSVILFDAMLFHRAGVNSSARVRRGLNHVYSTPIVRQQIEFAGDLDWSHPFFQEEAVRLLLGYNVRLPRSAREFRRQRAARLGVALEAGQ